uniref:THAP domain-containing protein 4 n=1 Tax=Lygus hesperus TaxID=30085 RepID=A0A0A9XPA7_LYGHE
MGCCPAIGCKNRSGKKKPPGITFHRFPSDPVKRQLWIEALQRNGWKPNLTTCLCSAHFKEEEIDRTANLVRIRVGAVPSVFFPTLSSGRISRKERALESPATTPSAGIRANTATGKLQEGWKKEKLSLNIGRKNDKRKFRGAHSGDSSTSSHNYGLCKSPSRSQSNRILENGGMTSNSEPSRESDKAEICKLSTDSSSEQVLDGIDKLGTKRKSTINNKCSVPLTSKTETCQSFDSTEQNESHLQKTLKTQLQRKEERIRALKKKIRQLQQTSRRMTRRLSNLKDLVDNMKIKLRSQETHSSLDGFPGASWFLVKRQMIKMEGGKLQRIYNEKLKDFALTLNFMSPSAYDYVRRVFGDCLPHRKTISKWILKNRKQAMKDSMMGEQLSLEEPGTLTEQCVLGDDGLVGAPGYVEVVRTDPEVVSADVQGIRLGEEDENAEKTLISL